MGGNGHFSKMRKRNIPLDMGMCFWGWFPQVPEFIHYITHSSQHMLMDTENLRNTVWLTLVFSVSSFYEGDNRGRGAQQQAESESPSSQVTPSSVAVQPWESYLIHCEPPFPIYKTYLLYMIIKSEYKTFSTSKELMCCYLFKTKFKHSKELNVQDLKQGLKKL